MVTPYVNFYKVLEFEWDENYLTKTPPGDLPGLNAAGTIVLQNNEDNFNTHCKALQGNIIKIE